MKNLIIKIIFCLMAILLLNQNAYAELRDSVSLFGITWRFGAPAECGQFVNGDWWVVGPVTVSSVSPAPRAALSNEVNDLGTNQWGDTGLQNDTTCRNGSMVVMTASRSQGYDSRGRTYSASISITFPYQLETNRSLISSISMDTIPSLQMHEAIMWTSEMNGRQVMKTAAVLTCLSAAPAADAFRPTYAGSDKRIFRLSQVKWDRLKNLNNYSLPSWAQYERYFERPWIDHMNGAWEGQWLLPIQNMPSYGREFVRIVSVASLMLQTNATQVQKQKLLIGLVQYGIDLRGIAEVGGFWNEGGGHTSGRKWPIIFAGLILDDTYFFNMPASAIFHEDVQTYYGKGWAGQTALWQMVTHHGARLPYMHVDPSTWSTYDGGWATTSESYRTCCTIKAWPGQALAALLMSAKSVWNHNAYFDNVEDWMRQEDIYAAGRGGRTRPGDEGGPWWNESFIADMWNDYRSSVPVQFDGAVNLMWDAKNNKWVGNSTEPVFSPAAGTYNSAQSVTITTPVISGATVRYTTDGSTPTSTTGAVYSGPITINSPTTIKAIAYKNGMTPSPVSSALYTVTTGIGENISDNKPAHFALNQNYPNPFNPTTKIDYMVKNNEEVILKVVDILGKKVKVLVNERKGAGSYTTEWDGTNEKGQVVSNGIYFVQMNAGDYSAVRKMIYIK